MVLIILIKIMSKMNLNSDEFKKAYTGFNSVIDQFIDNLIQLLPNNSDLKVFKSKLSQLRYAQPTSAKQLLKTFAVKLIKYKEHILSKNEKFFTEDLEIDNGYIAEAIKIKDLWKNNIKEKNKEIIWKYFFIMLKMASKIIPNA